MATRTCKHTADTCLAYQYCVTLESFGVTGESTKECLFDWQENTPKLSKSAQKQIGESQTDSVLIERLVSAAIEQLEYMNKLQKKALDFNKLYDLREQVFNARMELWKAMISSAQSARPFTDVELGFRCEKINWAHETLLKAAYTTDKTTTLRTLCAHDRMLKNRYSLQFDSLALKDIDRLVGNIVNTRPTLIVGDKGIAKTQIAKFVMELCGKDPIIISVKGDMMSDELIGKIKHDRKRNTFIFQEGMLLTAMRKGLPVLLDEINFGDQAIIARLQDILLKKPGEKVFVQESGDEYLTVAPGFVVFATANEASLRYRHREVLDPAIRDRFDIIIRTYPNLDNDPIVDVPTSLLRIALSSAVNAWGLPSVHIDLSVLESFVRLAHITQYLYAVPARSVALDLNEDRMTSMVLEESQPLMTDCITPRTLSNLIIDCSGGNLPGFTLDFEHIEKSILALDQAGSTHNRELADQVKFLLDIKTKPEETDEERGRALEQEAPPLQDNVCQRAKNDPFSLLSDNAYRALTEIDKEDAKKA